MAMTHEVAVRFGDRQTAQRAREDLLRSGFSEDEVQLSTPDANYSSPAAPVRTDMDSD